MHFYQNLVLKEIFYPGSYHILEYPSAGILSALFIGASLSVAGSTYQGMFRNPLVSPDILGVSSGASLGAAFAILNGASTG